MDNKNKKFANNQERLEYLNNKQNEIAQKQEDGLVIDFDRAIMENKKTIKVKFLNKIYHLPAEMPFNFSTFFLRNCVTKGKNGQMLINIPDDKVIEFIELMFGVDFVNAVENCKDNKISINLIMQIIAPPVLKEWGYDTKATPEMQKKTQAMMRGL